MRLSKPVSHFWFVAIVATPFLAAAPATADNLNCTDSRSVSLNWISVSYRRVHIFVRHGRHHFDLPPTAHICTHDWFWLVRISGRGFRLDNRPSVVCLPFGLFILQHADGDVFGCGLRVLWWRILLRRITSFSVFYSLFHVSFNKKTKIK